MLHMAESLLLLLHFFAWMGAFAEAIGGLLLLIGFKLD
jgi:uncharacterized membrane protein YphA (DoxX/SURF4 family)